MVAVGAVAVAIAAHVRPAKARRVDRARLVAAHVAGLGGSGAVAQPPVADVEGDGREGGVAVASGVRQARLAVQGRCAVGRAVAHERARIGQVGCQLGALREAPIDHV